MADMDRVKYEYDMVTDSSKESFLEGCDQYLFDGWTAQGGVNVSSFVSYNEVFILYAQAFVREVPREGDE